MWNDLKSSFAMLIFMTVITGLIYPVMVTAVAQGFLAKPANGSLIMKDSKPVGSELIGQSHDSPKYFWGRLSATSPYPYNASNSSGSNLGPTNPALLDAVSARIKALRDADPGNTAPVPVDLVTASASGLDPHISPAAAAYQVSRVAKGRGLDNDKMQKLLDRYTEPRQFGILGEPRVNVLKLNLALDQLR